MDGKLPQDVIQYIINNSHAPIHFKNILKCDNNEYIWQLLNWDLDTLSQKIGNVKLPFREGINKKTIEPQWEYKCEVKYYTMAEFLTLSNNINDNKWHYFDYKCMNDWFKGNSEILNSINWNALGCNIESEASTIWLGNKGAHTNCHKDTYGNNLIAQIYGRKQWILFPPDIDNFCETRNPYEESTIYTKLNLFTPSLRDIAYLKSLNYRPRVLTLEPGDLLFVPHGWWHFVESLDVSLSVNVWSPLKTDCYNRLNEALVKLLVNKLGTNIAFTHDVDKCSLSQSLNFVKQSLTECKLALDTSENSLIRKDTCKLDNIFKKYSNYIKSVDEMSMNEFDDFLHSRHSRFLENDYNLVKIETHNLENEILNTFCNTNIIQQIAKILFTHYCNKSI